MPLKDLKPRRPDRHRKTPCPECGKAVRNGRLEQHRLSCDYKKRRGFSFVDQPGDHHRKWYCAQCKQTISYRQKSGPASPIASRRSDTTSRARRSDRTAGAARRKCAPRSGPKGSLSSESRGTDDH